MRQIDLNEWIAYGAGSNGKTYRPLDETDDSVILKVNFGSSSSYKTVKEEFDSSNAVLNLGVETPRMYEMVQVGKRYGTLIQRVKGKESLCRICADNPDRIEEMAALMSRKGRELHALDCDTSYFHPISEYLFKGLGVYRPFLSKSQCATLEQWIKSLPETKKCLHGDFNPGNLILAGGRQFWIDLGRFSYGDPFIDISHLYLFCVEMSHTRTVQELSHMTEEQLKAFWKAFLKAEGVTSEEDVAIYEAKARKYMALDMLARQGVQRYRFLAFLLSPRIKKIISSSR